jgi:hypothetical protein
MNNSFAKTGKPRDKQFSSETTTQSTVSSDYSLMFQVFFLSQDKNQSVEIVETNKLDYGEITYRLKSGESVFIKNKNQETLESDLKENKEKDQNWYFTN